MERQLVLVEYGEYRCRYTALLHFASRCSDTHRVPPVPCRCHAGHSTAPHVNTTLEGPFFPCNILFSARLFFSMAVVGLRILVSQEHDPDIVSILSDSVGLSLYWVQSPVQ
jgi:hypothetical protein